MQEARSIFPFGAFKSSIEASAGDTAVESTSRVIEPLPNTDSIVNGLLGHKHKWSVPKHRDAAYKTVSAKGFASNASWPLFGVHPWILIGYSSSHSCCSSASRERLQGFDFRPTRTAADRPQS